jgi:hypothetical protein
MMFFWVFAPCRLVGIYRRVYIAPDKEEHHPHRRENLKSQDYKEFEMPF